MKREVYVVFNKFTGTEVCETDKERYAQIIADALGKEYKEDNWIIEKRVKK